MALEDVQIYVETAAGAAVSGVYVGLHNSATKAKVGSAYSTAAGLVTFAAVESTTNNGVYELRIAPPFPAEITSGNVQSITVLTAPEAPLQNAFTLKVTPEALPTATHPRLCRCSGYFVDSTGAALNGVSLHFMEEDLPQLQYVASSSDYETTVVVPSKRSVTTSKNTGSGKDGYVAIDLYRDCKYTLFMEGFENYPRTVHVPDSAAVNVSDLIFPVVSTVEYKDGDTKLVPTASPTTTVAVSATKELSYEVLLRSGLKADPAEVTFTNSDEAVAKLAVNYQTKVLTLEGISNGQATITISKTSDDGIKVSPAPTLIGNLTVTVNG